MGQGWKECAHFSFIVKIVYSYCHRKAWCMLWNRGKTHPACGRMWFYPAVGPSYSRRESQICVSATCQRQKKTKCSAPLPRWWGWGEVHACANDAMAVATVYQVRTIFWHNRWRGAVPHVSNRMKRSNLPKRDKKYSVRGVWGVREKGFLFVVVMRKVPKTGKNIFVLQFCSWDGSFRYDEMKIWLCLYFQHDTRYIGTDFVEESRQKMQRSEKEHLFAKGALIRRVYFK